MAKLYFYYSAMNAGKSTSLLQSSYNYQERGMRTFLLTPEIDARFEVGKITSRIGLEATASTFNNNSNLFTMVTAETETADLGCVMVDEAQFLTRTQVQQLSQICDECNIPVLAYGLRTDFMGEPFEGSQYLLAWADNLKEIKAICHCGSKATMVLRLDESGTVAEAGDQIEIGGNDRYVSVCRHHFFKKEAHA
ncbi:MAG: thymidine kinase [Candidatus Azotimanducaceae bacterium]|jgi:thymidine kinase